MCAYVFPSVRWPSELMSGLQEFCLAYKARNWCKQRHWMYCMSSKSMEIISLVYKQRLASIKGIPDTSSAFTLCLFGKEYSTNDRTTTLKNLLHYCLLGHSKGINSFFQKDKLIWEFLLSYYNSGCVILVFQKKTSWHIEV